MLTFNDRVDRSEISQQLSLNIEFVKVTDMKVTDMKVTDMKLTDMKLTDMKLTDMKLTRRVKVAHLATCSLVS